jgi:glycosyltransferase involved in cell wall biosynthesis
MDYDFSVDSDTLEKKFTGLGRGMKVFILARGKGWHHKKYGAEFYLTPKWGTYIWMKLSYWRGLFIIFSRKIDVIVCQSPLFDGFVGAWLKIFTRRELIIEVHSDWINSLFYQHNIPFPRLVKQFFIMIGRFSLARADKVRVISTATEKLVRENSKHTEFYRFPTFTDIDMFKAEADTSYEPVIMYAGWLYKLKGLQFLIEAWSRLQDKYPAFKILIVGDGPYRAELEEKVKKLKVKRVEFVGWKKLHEVKELMRNCYAFILPSLSEGLGRVLIEAAMLRKPAIGSRVDGIPDIIQDKKTGYLVEPGNIDDIEDKLDSLLGNPELARQMGEAGREFVEDKFSTEKYFKEYIRMIDDRISRNTHR